MLTNFFRLNAPFKNIDATQLEDHFKLGSDLQNALYAPDAWPAVLSKVKGKTFTNVSLSKTRFEEITFTNCVFTDCLFIGSEFVGVEFHNCRFINCNVYKVIFSGCYIDPKSFYFDKSYRSTHSNVGVGLYQKVLENSAEEKQDEFARSADIFFRRWKRDQYHFDHKAGKLGKRSLITKVVGNWVYETIAGYGYSPARYAFATILAFSAASVTTTLLMSGHLKIGETVASNITIYDGAFYTYSMMTALGFSSVVPVTPFAKLYAISLALIGIAWLGVFTSLLVKRVLK